jgi:hypothetical protein
LRWVHPKRIFLWAFLFIDMAYRFTNTEKWQDAWFCNLKQMEMLLFMYLCDNCDIAGFIELNYKRWANDLNSSIPTIEGASKGLARGLIYSETNDCIFLRNFLKHQKNLPLNENNKAHLGIIKRFELYSQKFNIQDINEFIQRGIEGASKGLLSPTGNGNDSIIDSSILDWKKDFEVYKEFLKGEYIRIVTPEYIKRRKEFHPNLNIKKTLAKSIEDFWLKERGWKNKKASKSKTIDWEATFNNSIGNKINWVYDNERNH